MFFYNNDFQCTTIYILGLIFSLKNKVSKKKTTKKLKYLFTTYFH